MRVSMVSKPKYRIPSMEEIEKLPWNSFNVVSTFSGGGGSCLGYRMAGYNILYSNEFVEEAQKTYRINHPKAFLDTRDIREITGQSILDRVGLEVGEIDLFDGSPPCCAFSTAGKREKGWGKERRYSDGKKQVIDDLFFEYARLIKELQPKVFIAENVSGLVKGTAKGYFKLIFKALENCGYEVKAQLLNAKWLGIPQSRERIIFQGIRKDIVEKYDVHPAFPKPFNYTYSVRDAFDGIIQDKEQEYFLLSPEVQKYSCYRILEKIPKNPDKPINGEKYADGSYFSLVRLSYKKPSPTICQTGGFSLSGLCHPIYNRKLTIPEIKRLMSIPDDFVLTGNYAQQHERLGRMVPPLMMKAIAETVAKEVLCKIT